MARFGAVWMPLRRGQPIFPRSRPGIRLDFFEVAPMIIVKQAVNHPYIPQERALVVERKDLGACPLGTIGNLHFRAEQGGTPRASRIGVMLTDAWHTLLKLSHDLMYCFTFERPEGQEEHAEFMAARRSSRRIGNLLGCLTAPANDVHADFRTAQALAQLAQISRGDLADLQGGRESLGCYLNELSDADLIALRNGVLGCPAARAAVLEEVARTSYWAQNRAPEVLDQIARSLSRQFAKKVVQEPFTRIGELLSASPVDGAKLQETLIRLARGLDQFKASRELTVVGSDDDPLDVYLRLLTREQRQALMTEESIARLRDAHKALAADRDDSEHPACIMLERITATLTRELAAPGRPERRKEPSPSEEIRAAVEMPRKISPEFAQKIRAIEPLLEEIAIKRRARADADVKPLQVGPIQAEGPRPGSPDIAHKAVSP